MNVRRSDRGLVLPMVAIVITVLITFASFAIDLGYQRVARRDMQALADVVALDLARDVDGRTAAQILADPAWDQTRLASVARNDDTVGAAPGVVAELGDVNETTGVFTTVSGTAVPNAVRVGASTSVNFFFRPGTGAASRSAIGMQVPRANFMVGSFLAGTDPDLDLDFLDRYIPRRIGSVLDRLTGNPTLGMTLVSYQGLVSSQLDMTRLAAELGAGSPNQLASAGAYNAKDVYLASARVMDQTGHTAAATVFRTVAAEADSTATINFGEVFVQQGGASQASGGTNVNMGGLAFLNSTISSIDNASFVSIPGLNFAIPGVTSSTVTVTVVEAPQYCAAPNFLCRVGHEPPVTTSQVRVRLENVVDLPLTIPLALGTPSATGTLVTDTNAAGATARLTAARCAAGTGVQGIDVGVVSQAITSTVTETLDIRTTLAGVGTNVARVNVASSPQLASGTGGSASFAHPSEFLPTEGTGTTKRVGSPSLNLATGAQVSASNVTVVGTPNGITPDTVAIALNEALPPTVTAIENVVTRRIARTLGLYIGGADVGAVDLECGGVALIG